MTNIKINNQFNYLIMRKIVIISALTWLLLSCGSNKLIQKEITGNYTNVIFTPKEINKSLPNNLSLTIEPIDAKTLNQEIFETMMRDGGYEKQLYSSDIFVEQKLTKNERRILERYKVVEKYINDLLREGKINQQVAVLFKERIINSLFGTEIGTPGFDGSEIHSSLGNNRYSEFNPYRVNNNYLSLFRLHFNNKSNSILSVDLGSFQVSDNRELLYPFNNEYFDKNLKDDSEKMKYIYRMNMPDKLTITPSQQTVKYISIPAINPNSEEINVSYIIGNEVVTYPFKLNVETIKEKFVYLLYNIEIKNRNRSFYGEVPQYVLLVENENNIIFPLRDNTVFINETEKSKPLTIHVLSVPYRGDKFGYGQSTISPSEYAKRKIELEVDIENK